MISILQWIQLENMMREEMRSSENVKYDSSLKYDISLNRVLREKPFYCSQQTY